MKIKFKLFSCWKNTFFHWWNGILMSDISCIFGRSIRSSTGTMDIGHKDTFYNMRLTLTIFSTHIFAIEFGRWLNRLDAQRTLRLCLLGFVCDITLDSNRLFPRITKKEDQCKIWFIDDLRKFQTCIDWENVVYWKYNKEKGYHIFANFQSNAKYILPVTILNTFSKEIQKKIKDKITKNGIKK